MKEEREREVQAIKKSKEVLHKSWLKEQERRLQEQASRKELQKMREHEQVFGSKFSMEGENFIFVFIN